MKNKSYTLFLILIILISCTKEIEIDIPVRKQALVVYSTLLPFTFPHPKSLNITLQHTGHIFDSTKYVISDAAILYYENDVLQDTLFCKDSTGTYNITTSLSDYPVVGNSYSIKILKDGYETATASTIIPSKVVIKDTVVTPIAYFDETGSVFSQVSVTFDDPPKEMNFYELAISDIAFSYDNPKSFYELTTYDNIVTSESYYPSLLRFDIDKPRYLLFSDKKINGKEYTLNVYYTPPQSEDEHRYITNHYISIHFRNVTEEYFKYKTSLIQHLNSKKEDVLYGMGEPLNVISNIQNGYGLFAGFNNDIVSLHINEQMIK